MNSFPHSQLQNARGLTPSSGIWCPSQGQRDLCARYGNARDGHVELELVHPCVLAFHSKPRRAGRATCAGRGVSVRRGTWRAWRRVEGVRTGTSSDMSPGYGQLSERWEVQVGVECKKVWSGVGAWAVVVVRCEGLGEKRKYRPTRVYWIGRGPKMRHDALSHVMADFFWSS
ncbi:hypothetical protein CALVIDRAFT_431199 [Calocera viscosa TUFC12733]|uniref:Uncharacterized protein n=1 Tax=Calocera viscosa (strain TUFC12733) TaxID=1330018 RepID=A0A167FZJ5_CALVF|nr:hypothetical protein CALVIDRAFT_431199 [Calocera viscosa TUFC12733]